MTAMATFFAFAEVVLVRVNLVQALWARDTIALNRHWNHFGGRIVALGPGINFCFIDVDHPIELRHLKHFDNIVRRVGEVHFALVVVQLHQDPQNAAGKIDRLQQVRQLRWLTNRNSCSCRSDVRWEKSSIP